MTELEQLRKEINELRERIAVLEKRSHAGAISEFEEALKKCKQQYAYQQYRDSLPGTPPQQQSIGIWGAVPIPAQAYHVPLQHRPV